MFLARAVARVGRTALNATAATTTTSIRAGSAAVTSSVGTGRPQTSHHGPAHHETPEEWDARMEGFFNRTDLDGWDVRRGLQELHMSDHLPEPSCILAILQACRRINDHSLAIRFLETLRENCEMDKTAYPWLMEQVKAGMRELGVSSVEEMGYDKPEFWLEDADDIH